ncbi:MAG: hypothetical protein ACUVUC_13585 [Thermoguttaceae bacterium]
MVAERDDRAFLWEYVFTVPQESHFPGQIEPYGLRSPDWTPEDEVRWHRGLDAYWILIQPTQQDINAGIFPWEQNDREWGQVPESMTIFANIGLPEQRMAKEPGKPWISGWQLNQPEEAYIRFVKAVVERYDGDGVDDMTGLNVPIRYWQFENE